MVSGRADLFGGKSRECDNKMAYTNLKYVFLISLLDKDKLIFKYLSVEKEKFSKKNSKSVANCQNL